MSCWKAFWLSWVFVWYGTASGGFVKRAISNPLSGEAFLAMPTLQKIMSNFSSCPILASSGKGRLSAL